MPLKKSAEKTKKIPEKSALNQLVETVKGEGGKNRVISEALEKKETTNSTFLETKELGKSIEKKEKKSLLKWAIGGALGMLGLATGKEIADKKSQEKISETVSDIVTDEQKLKSVNDVAEKTHKEIEKHKKGVQFLEKGLGVNINTQWEEKLDTYRNDEYGVQKLFLDTWKDTEYSDTEKTKRRSWVGRAVALVPLLFANFSFFRKVKSWQKKGFLEKFDAARESSKKISKTAKKAKDLSDKAIRTKETLASQMAENKELVYLKKQKTKSFVNDYRKNIAQATTDLQYKKISGKEYAKKLQKTTTNLFEKVKNGGTRKEFLELIKQKKIPGISLTEKASSAMRKMSGVPVAGLGVASAINISILDAVRDGDFGSFFKSVTSKQTLMESFIPGIGIRNSIRRSQESDDPTWLKGVDVGINVLGDGLMAAGIIGGIFTGGTSALGAYAAKGSILAVARGWMTKQSLKYASKKLLKTGKNAAKLSLITSPLTLGLGMAARAIDNKAIQESFEKNILTKEQQRSLSLAKAA